MSSLIDIIVGFIAALVSAAFLHFGAGGGSAPAHKTPAPEPRTELQVPADIEDKVAEPEAPAEMAPVAEVAPVKAVAAVKAKAVAEIAPAPRPKPAPRPHVLAPQILAPLPPLAPPAAPKPPVMHFSLIVDQDVRTEIEQRLEADIEREMARHQQRIERDAERAARVEMHKAELNKDRAIEAAARIMHKVVVKAQVAVTAEPVVSGPDCPQNDEGRDRPQNIRTFTGH
ncbi:hypothetical protein [Asticcacaulis sp. YBE204]|uniref:hypothetical protein n=1 Tax=Asticcacaulis sp. YBE204 TaxID=1282363 RepID=UPI0003C3E5D5|nr:hypothetical protein [Asticcacaulis sp. YBE204]ESQ79854.1 hypothetical protein AEYBE204_08390 [Asticcacaulis sp. YBE204]